ncbi:MAG: MFS transporter, partial [Bacillota bacterium]
MGTSRKAVYSLGSLGAGLLNNAVTTYIVFYYVDVLKTPAAAIAKMMVIWSIWNAINDPLLGFISDGTRSRFGRRIPYIIWGWLPLVASFYLLWAPPAPIREAASGSLVWYFLAAICVYDFLYTMVVLNWTSLFPEMFPELKERSAVSAMRSAWALVGLVLGVALGSTVAGVLGWEQMGLVFGAIGGLSLAASVLGAREDPRFSQTQALPLIPAVRSTLANFSFVTFALTSFSVQLTFAVIMAAIPFYTKYVLGLSLTENPLVLASTFAVIA